MLNEGALVLEGVTLAQVVQLVVEVLVDLAAGTVLDEETAEDTEAAHPKDLAVIRPHQHPAQPYFFRFPQIHATNSSHLIKTFRTGGSACLPRHTSVLGTLPLTVATVTTDTASGVQLPGAATGVHGNRLADDEAIGNQLADGLAGVGVGDLVDLVGVEPDLALAAADDLNAVSTCVLDMRKRGRKKGYLQLPPISSES